MVSEEAAIWDVLRTVPDPEIPVLNIVELGMVRGIETTDDGSKAIVLTPTYTGCPATEVIRRSVAEALAAAGLSDLEVRYRLTPPWSTDWITPEGREKLRRHGIAPPRPRRSPADAPVACPRCGATDTELVAEFGSTPCKAAMRCRACLEPFEAFKCL